MSEEAWQAWVDNLRSSPTGTQQSQWALLTEEQRSYLESRFRLFGPSGSFRGKAYGEWKQDIEALKRAGRSEDAIKALAELLEAAKTDGFGDEQGGPLPVWCCEQLAILYRKAKRHDEEVGHLEEMVQCGMRRDPRIRKMIRKRIERAYQLAGRLEYRTDGDSPPIALLNDGRPFSDHTIFFDTLSVVDVETTGFSSKDEMIELAILNVRVRQRDGTVETLSEYSGLRQPRVRINPAARKVHGLSMSDLFGRQLDLPRVEAMLKGSDYLVSHNAGFDRRFVEAAVPSSVGMQWLCSMNGIGWLEKGFPDRKLSQLLSAHGIVIGSHHRALSDASGLVELLRTQDKSSGRPYIAELLESRPLRPPRVRSNDVDSPREIRVQTDGIPRASKTGGGGCASALAAIGILAALYWLYLL